MKLILCCGLVWLFSIDRSALATDTSELAHENNDYKLKRPIPKAREWLENVKFEAQKRPLNDFETEQAKRDLFSDLKVRSDSSSSFSFSSLGKMNKRWKKAFKHNKYGKYSHYPFGGHKAYKYGGYGGGFGGYDGGFGNYGPFGPSGYGGYPSLF